MAESDHLEWLTQAELLADARRWAEAIALCDRVLSESSDSAAALNLKGFCFAASGRVPEALPCFKLARLYLPTAVDIRHNLARALEKTGDAAAALVEYGEVLKLDGDQLEARLSRIVLREASGDEAGAGADLDELVRRHPDLPRAWLLRGGWHLTRGRPAQALPDLKKALELDPGLQEQVDGLVAAVRGDAGGA